MYRQQVWRRSRPQHNRVSTRTLESRLAWLMVSRLSKYRLCVCVCVCVCVRVCACVGVCLYTFATTARTFPLLTTTTKSITSKSIKAKGVSETVDFVAGGGAWLFKGKKYADHYGVEWKGFVVSCTTRNSIVILLLLLLSLKCGRFKGKAICRRLRCRLVRLCCTCATQCD
jgi:hypothetical protein